MVFAFILRALLKVFRKSLGIDLNYTKNEYKFQPVCLGLDKTPFQKAKADCENIVSHEVVAVVPRSCLVLLSKPYFLHVDH